jgi:DNA-binding CsgD family transcriptional regulator
MGSGGQTTSDRLVGRELEWGVLRSALRHAQNGEPRIVLVSGAPGMGKSLLVREFLAAHPGIRVVEAFGDATETQVPYGLLQQLLISAGSGSVTASSTVRPDADPIAGGMELLESVSQGPASTVVLVVDDVQWADQLSLQALTFALRRLASDRVLGLVLVRADDLERLPEGLRHLASTERGAALALAPFGPRDVRRLAEELHLGELSMVGADRLAQHTRGLPLHVRALLDELPVASINNLALPLPAPHSFAMLVLSRLAECSVQTQSLVMAVTVLGSPCDLGLSLRLARTQNESVDAVAGLDEAVRRRLLDEIEPGRRIGCPHPLVQAAIYSDLGPARRRDLHLHAAALTTGPTQLAHRIAASIGPDPRLAADLERAAGEQVAGGAIALAGSYLLAAARLCDIDSADYRRLLCDGADLLLHSGEMGAAAGAAREIADLTRGTDRDTILGHFELVNGDPGRAEALLSAAWDMRQGGDDQARAAEAATLLAHLCLTRLRSAESITWANRAMIGQPAESPRYPQAILASALAVAGRPEAGLQLLGDLPVSVDQLKSPGVVDAVTGRGTVRLWTDDLVGAQADLLLVLEASATIPTPSWSQALGHLLDVEYRIGAWDDAIVLSERAVAVCEDLGHVWLRAFLRGNAALVPAARGSWDVAQSHVDAAWSSAQSLGVEGGYVYASVARAELATARQDWPAVLTAVAPLVNWEDKDGLNEPGLSHWRELQVRALIHEGRLADADIALTRYEKASASRARTSGMVGADSARGHLSAAAGDAIAAQNSFERAVELLPGLPMPYLAAQVHLDFGEFLRRTGKRRAAAEHLRRAQGILASLGAEPLLARCQRELAACGLRSESGGRSDRRDLTPRELAIATLVAAGKSNREVSAELFVSIKTVEYHLGKIFTKLGIDSRARLIAAWRAEPH